MKQSIFIFELFFICSLIGCKSGIDRENTEGFQFFEEYGISLKVPCNLVLDTTIFSPKEMGTLKAFVCPQIFADTSRTAFDMKKLIESDNSIYHFRIWEDQPNIYPSETIANLEAMLKAAQIETMERTIVDENIALIYGPLQQYTWEANIPLEFYTVNVAVTGDSSLFKLKGLLDSMLIEK